MVWALGVTLDGQSYYRGINFLLRSLRTNYKSAQEGLNLIDNCGNLLFLPLHCCRKGCSDILTIFDHTGFTNDRKLLGLKQKVEHQNYALVFFFMFGVSEDKERDKDNNKEEQPCPSDHQ